MGVNNLYPDGRTKQKILTMDFGILYIPNKAASTAAMVLGFLACAVFIYIPLILAYLFVPLYLAVVIMAISGKHKGRGLKFPLLLPLAPFAVSGFLTLLLWPALPTLVNAVHILTTLLFGSLESSVYRKDIPDNECILDFFLFLGGSFGSFFSVLSICGAFDEFDSSPKYRTENDDRSWQEIWIERKFKEDGIKNRYVKPTYQVYKTYTDKKITTNARDFFIGELSKQSVDQRIIDLIWEKVKWMFEEGKSNNNGLARLKRTTAPNQFSDPLSEVQNELERMRLSSKAYEGILSVCARYLNMSIKPVDKEKFFIEECNTNNIINKALAQDIWKRIGHLLNS